METINLVNLDESQSPSDLMELSRRDVIKRMAALMAVSTLGIAPNNSHATSIHVIIAGYLVALAAVGSFLNEVLKGEGSPKLTSDGVIIINCLNCGACLEKIPTGDSISSETVTELDAEALANECPVAGE